MLALFSAIAGLVTRLFPSVLELVDKKSERKHEIEMQKIAYGFEKLRGQNQISAIQEQGIADLNVEEMTAYKEAIKSQFKPSGVKWIDGLSKLIRPLITLEWLCLLYPGFLIASFILSVNVGIPALEALQSVFGEAERTLVEFIAGFWFMGRVIEKRWPFNVR